MSISQRTVIEVIGDSGEGYVNFVSVEANGSYPQPPVFVPIGLPERLFLVVRGRYTTGPVYGTPMVKVLFSMDTLGLLTDNLMFSVPALVSTDTQSQKLVEIPNPQGYSHAAVVVTNGSGSPAGFYAALVVYENISEYPTP